MCCFTVRRDLERHTLAGIIANEMGVYIKITSGPAIEIPGEMAAILYYLQVSRCAFCSMRSTG